MTGMTRRPFLMDLLTRTLLLLLVAGAGFLAGAVVHPGEAAPGPGKAPPCGQATPAAAPSSPRVGVGSYNGWKVRVTRFTLHKPGQFEQLAPGYALYRLHVIVDNEGTRTWQLYSNEFKLEDEHHTVYESEPISTFTDVHRLEWESLTPGTKVEGDVLKFAPAHGHFRLRVFLPQQDGAPDLIVPLPPLQAA